MKKSKSVLLRAIVMMCFFGFFAAHSQTSEMSIKVDLLRKEIITYITLKDIPKGTDIIWQQKIPQEAHFSSYGRGNQNADSKVIMMSFSRHLLTSAMSFSFSCTMDAIGDWIIWGESSITYTTKESKERVVKFPAKLFIIADHLIDPAEQLNQQESNNYLGDNADSKQSSIIVVTMPEEIKKQPNTVVEPVQEPVKPKETVMDESKKAPEPQKPVTTVIAPQDVVTTTIAPQKQAAVIAPQKPVTATIVPQEPVAAVVTPQEPVPTTITPQEPVAAVVTPQEPVQTTVTPQEPVTTTITPQKPITTAVAPQEPITATVAPQKVVTTPVAPQPAKIEPSFQSGYYIQVSSLSKSNLAEIKKYIHLSKEDNVIEVKRDKLFVYYVGPFSTMKEATDKLEYYKNYVPDAYVKKL